MSGSQNRASTPRHQAAPSLGAQAVWLLTAKTIAFAFAVALPLVLVRRLSQVDFGIYKQVFLVVGTAVTILPLGFGMSAFYFLPRERTRAGAVVINIITFHLAVGMLLALVLWMFPALPARIFNSPALTEHARLMSVVIVLWTVGSFLEIAPVALQDVRASTVLIVVSQFSKTALLLAAAVVAGTVHALLVAAIVQGVAQMVLLWVYLHRRFPHFWRCFDPRLLWQQATYAVPVGASGLVQRLQDDVHHAFVSQAFGPAAYAVYAVGVFRLPLVGMLRESVGSVVLPRINELEARNAPRDILILVAAAARKLALVYLPGYALFMVLGREIVQVMFTSRYVAAWPILAVSMTLDPLTIIVLDPVTRAFELRYFFLVLRLCIFGVLLFVLWHYTAALGMVGVMAAVVFSYFIVWTVAVVRMARLLHARRTDVALFADVGRIVLISATAAVITAVVRHWVGVESPLAVLLVCGPVFVLTYMVGIVQLGVLRRAEVRRLRQEVWRSVFGRARPDAALQAGSAASPNQSPVRSGP